MVTGAGRCGVITCQSVVSGLPYRRRSRVDIQRKRPHVAMGPTSSSNAELDVKSWLRPSLPAGWRMRVDAPFLQRSLPLPPACDHIPFPIFSGISRPLWLRLSPCAFWLPPSAAGSSAPFSLFYLRDFFFARLLVAFFLVAFFLAGRRFFIAFFLVAFFLATFLFAAGLLRAVAFFLVLVRIFEARLFAVLFAIATLP